MPRKIYDRGGNILAFMLVLTVYSLVNIIPIGGQTTGEISDKYQSLFKPACCIFTVFRSFSKVKK